MDKVFTLAELADRWAVRPIIIREMIHRGELRAFKVGREFRVKGAEVARIEDGEETS